MELELRHLRLISAVAETGTLSAAARLLGMAQPNVSVQLQRIEKLLDRTLFTRGSGGVRITPAGRAVLARARDVTNLVDDIRRAAPADKGRVPTEVRLATRGLTVEACVARLPQPWCEVRTAASETSPDHGLHGLLGGTVDVFVGLHWPHEAWPVHPELVEYDLLSERLIVILAKTHPLAGEPFLDLSQLAAEPWVARTDLITTEQECLAAGFVPDIKYRRDDNIYYQTLVGGGMAVAFASPLVYLTPYMTMLGYSNASAITWKIVTHPDNGCSEFVRLLAEEIRVTYQKRWSDIAATHPDLHAQLDLLWAASGQHGALDPDPTEHP